jgi:F0F1-type ATP synthase assembly protein I
LAVPEQPSPPSSPSGNELAGLALLLAAVVVIPLIVGLRVDASLNTAPLGIIVGLLLGIVAALAVVYVRFKRYL